MARFRVSFWLNAAKDDELLLLEEIDQLKKGRAFTRTIRDGIRLVLGAKSRSAAAAGVLTSTNSNG